MPERRGLGLLQVSLVGHHGFDVLVSPVDGHPGEGSGLGDQLDELAAQVQPQRDPGRLPPRPPGMQPPCDITDPGNEVVLAGVVRLAVGGVIGKLVGGDFVHLEQQRQQLALSRHRHDAAPGQVQHVRQVGQVQAAVQE